MDLENALRALPKWVFAVLAVILTGVIVYSMAFAKCRTTLFGLEFGRDISCTELENFASTSSGIEIIGSESRSNNSGVFQDSIRLEEPTLLIFSATGSATRDGSVANAGVDIRLTVNGEVCGMNQSFEGETSTVTFFAGATCVKLIQPGAHTIEAKRYDHPGITQKNFFKADYYLIRVQSSR